MTEAGKRRGQKGHIGSQLASYKQNRVNTKLNIFMPPTENNGSGNIIYMIHVWALITFSTVIFVDLRCMRVQPQE
jgi:hypothetical protein